MHEQNWVYLPCACQCALPVYPSPGWSIRARQVDRSSRSSAFSQQGYVSPWRQPFTHTHTHTHTRARAERHALSRLYMHTFLVFLLFSWVNITYKAILVLRRDLELAPLRASIQSSMRNWNTTLGNPCRNEALPLWRGSKADTCGNSEARGESEKRTTELKGKQKKLWLMTSLEDCFPGVWCVCTHATEHAVLRFDVFGCLSSTTTLNWGMNWYNWAYRIFLAFFHHTDQFDWGTTTQTCLLDLLHRVRLKACWRRSRVSANITKKRRELLWPDCETAQKKTWILQWHFICQCYQVMRFIYCSKKKSKVGY